VYFVDFVYFIFCYHVMVNKVIYRRNGWNLRW